MTTLEKNLLACLDLGDKQSPPETLFVLGAPRTGSTILYQSLCSQFGLPFIANLTNDYFPETPIIGFLIQKALPIEISFESNYGKTSGEGQPSEGSAVLANWFGGGHPSALASSTIVAGKLNHFLTTLEAAESLFGLPLVIKNPWNCFRIEFIAKTLLSARFIWIRRDIVAAAQSDLEARYTTKGTSIEWNSATPRNVEELRRLPPTAQVVENQYEFNMAIENDLKSHASGRWVQIWYEDFLDDPLITLNQLESILCIPQITRQLPVKLARGAKWNLSLDARLAIESYVTENECRLRAYRWSS